jgi:hypothetical protein
MAEIWNILDPDNPVYVQVARKTKSTRRTAQRRTLVVALAAVYLTYSNRGPILTIFSGPVNQFGVIRRK